MKPWVTGSRYVLAGVREPGYPNTRMHAKIVPTFGRFAWVVLSGSLSVSGLPSTEERIEPTAQAARDACLAWVMGAVMRGALLSNERAAAQDDE